MILKHPLLLSFPVHNTATQYDIESFDSALKPLWEDTRTHREKVRPLKSEEN